MPPAIKTLPLRSNVAVWLNRGTEVLPTGTILPGSLRTLLNANTAARAAGLIRVSTDVTLGTPEHEHVAIRIADLELPIAVRLVLERHLNKWLTANRVVQCVYSRHPDIRVPKPLWPSGREVWFFITGQRKEHDLRSVAL